MISEKRKSWCYIEDLHKLVWKDEILRLDHGSAEEDAESKVASTMAVSQKRTEDAIDSDADLVYRLLDSLRALDRLLKDGSPKGTVSLSIGLTSLSDDLYYRNTTSET